MYEYKWLRGLILNFVSAYYVGYSFRNSYVDENKQLPIAIVVRWLISIGKLHITNGLKLIDSSTFHFTPSLKKG